jgi:hypothetical protein
VGRSAYKKGSISRAVTMLCSSRLHRALPPSGTPDGVRWCFLERSVSGPPPPATSPSEGSRPWWCRRSCFLLAVVYRSATSRRLVLFHHCSASRIFIMQPDRNLWPVVIHKDDYQPCGGEKRAGLRPPSCPQLQGCSSSVLGRRASRGSAFRAGWRPVSSSSIRGRRASASLAKEANFGY